MGDAKRLDSERLCGVGAWGEFTRDKRVQTIHNAESREENENEGTEENCTHRKKVQGESGESEPKCTHLNLNEGGGAKRRQVHRKKPKHQISSITITMP